MKKIVIIGAGLTGSFLAHKLSHFDVELTVIDRQHDIANETSMANSAIVHTGYDPEDGTLKALLNVRGANLYPSICVDLHCDYNRCGAFVVARADEENALQELYHRAKKRHIDVEMMNGEQARKLELNLHDEITRVMSVPQTAIIYPWQVAIALMEEAVLNGCTLKLSEEVQNIEKKERFIITTNQAIYQADYVLNAAGCGAEHIAAMLEDKVPFEITLKKGQYFVLSKQAKGFVNHIIYPTPTKKGKGVLCVPTTHGNTLLGPTSEVENTEDIGTSLEGMNFIRERLSHMMNHIPYQEIIRSYSGLRATGNHNDFYIQESKEYKHFIHIACIDSPGLASAPAICEYVYDMFLVHADLALKDTFIRRSIPVVMNDLTLNEKQKKIKENSKYGHIVCRCENISKQEIIDAIHRPCGARSIKGIKKRVRPGMGFCQGGFCEPVVAKILAEELHMPLSDVIYDGAESKLGAINKGESL